MKASDLIASIGVIILLIAFFLNLISKIASDSKFYIWCNIIGASMNCYSSYLISFYPFVVLEAIWALVAFWSLLKIVPRGTISK
jgi:hypothetical protein